MRAPRTPLKHPQRLCDEQRGRRRRSTPTTAHWPERAGSHVGTEVGDAGGEDGLNIEEDAIPR